jgi:hypothetical protein
MAEDEFLELYADFNADLAPWEQSPMAIGDHNTCSMFLGDVRYALSTPVLATKWLIILDSNVPSLTISACASTQALYL